VAGEIEDALRRLGPDLGGDVADVRRLSGGASKETWAFSAGGRPLILRRSPGGQAITTAASLAAEAALIQAAGAAGVTAPKVVRVCPDSDGLGEAFIMEAVEGETLGRRIVREDAFADIRPGLARRCGVEMAGIHAIPLPGLPALETTDATAVIARYEAAYRELGAKRAVLEAAFVWLRGLAPPPAEPVLVHGDFRNGNLIVDPVKGLAAVLDWELAHLGDPAEDLGWICVNSWRFGGDAPVGGFGSYSDLLAGYVEGGGVPVTLERLRYWQAVGSLKWAVMCLMMYASYASGRDPSVERAMIGRRTSEAEADLVVLMEQGL
jgi:aminoglycoside phosphotransferase (APT) family kinase protein